jgi:hypothetical protein
MATFANADVDDDLKAINEFFHREPPKTPAAKVVFNEWVVWWESIQGNWYNGQAEFDHARNLRNSYNRANAVTPKEKELTERVITTGMSGEQQRGEADRRSATGDYIEPPPSDSIVKRWWFWPGVASGATLAVVFVVPKVVKAYLGFR